MSANSIDRTAQRFVFASRMEEKEEIIARMSASDHEALAASLMDRAGQEEGRSKRFLLWHVRLLSTFVQNDPGAFDNLIEEAFEERYLASRDFYRAVITPLLNDARSFFMDREAPALLAATEALLAWLSTATNCEQEEFIPTNRLQDCLDRLLKIDALNSAAMPMLLGASELMFSRPVVLVGAKDSILLEIMVAESRDLMSSGAPVLAAAILVAAGYAAEENGMRRDVLDMAAHYLEFPAGARYDRLLLTLLRAENAESDHARIELLDGAIKGLQTLQAESGVRFPETWRNDLAMAHMNRGNARRNTPGHGTLAAIEDYDNAIDVGEELRGEMALRFPEAWHSALAMAYMNRGNAKQDASGSWISAAVNDYDCTISILEALRLRMLDRFPETWSNDLASAYMNRGISKRNSPGHGASAVIEDHDRAIALRKALQVRMGRSFPEDWRHDLALAYINRGTAKLDAPGHGASAAIEDFDRGIANSEVLVGGMGARFPNAWRNILAGSFANRGTAKQTAPGRGLSESIDDYNRAIVIREELRAEMGEGFPEAWRVNLAEVYMNRANAKQNAIGFSASEALDDYDRAIAIGEALRVRMGDRLPAAWLNTLATVYMNRGTAKQDAPGQGASVAIDDYDLAISIFEALLHGRADRFPEAWRHGLATAYLNRGAARRNAPGQGAVAAMEDYGRAISICEALQAAMRESFPDGWRNDLARAYMNLGGAKADAPGHGVWAALEDYDSAIAMREGLRTAMGDRFPEAWLRDLATAYMNRATTKQNAPGHGPMAAIDDCNSAIAIHEALHMKMGNMIPRAWFHDLAKACMNRGNAKQATADYGALAAIKDYDRAIAINEALLNEKGAAVPEGWRNDLAGAYMNRGNAKKHALGYGELAAIEDYDHGIGVHELLLNEMGARCPEKWRNDLAMAYMNRGNAKHDSRGHGVLAALDDYDRAIAIREALRVAMGYNFPLAWRNDLAAAYSNRGTTKQRMPGAGASSAIEDGERARCIWRGTKEEPDVRIVAPDWYLKCCGWLSALLVSEGRYKQALDVLLEAGAFRISAAGSAVLLQEQREVLQAGASIASLGAWLLAHQGRPREGLEFLEAQQGVMLKEALLRNEDALAVRVGSDAAASISSIRARMHETRHILIGHGAIAGVLSRSFIEVASSEVLRDELRSLKVMFDKAVAKAGDALRPGGLRATDFAELVPLGGVVAVPVVTGFGSLILMLGSDAKVYAVDLPEDVTEDAVNRRVNTLLDAEKAYKDAQTHRSAADFEAVLKAEAAGYWTDVMETLWGCLAQLGYPPSAPVTIIATGALDLLPLHIASRVEGDMVKYAIEDRVIRFAPSFAALKQMKGHTQEKGIVEARVLGVFAPQKDNQAESQYEGHREDLSSALHKELPELDRLLGSALEPVVKSAATRNWFLGEMAKPERGLTDLHLSMHSEFDPDDPERSGLKFVDDDGEWEPVSVGDLLKLGEVKWLRHVCLASCQSGRSDTRQMPGESIGFVGAFIQAGAASVLSSYYVISDDATAEFIPAFYRRRMGGKDIAEALRNEVCDRLKVWRTSRPENRANGQPSTHKSEDREDDLEPVRSLRIGPAGVAQRQLSLLDWAAFKPTCA